MAKKPNKWIQNKQATCIGTQKQALPSEAVVSVIDRHHREIILPSRDRHCRRVFSCALHPHYAYEILHTKVRPHYAYETLRSW